MFTLPIRARLARLQGSLDSLGQQLRESIAGVVARATADAVRDAVRALLTEPHGQEALPNEPRSLWNHPGGSSWPEDELAEDGDPEDLDGSFRPPVSDRSDYGPLLDEEPFDAPRPELPSKPREAPLPRALIAGCQATAWWLRRHPGRYSVLAALGVGVAAGVTAFVSGSVWVGGASVAVTALGLVALADAARSVTGTIAGP